MEFADPCARCAVDAPPLAVRAPFARPAVGLGPKVTSFQSYALRSRQWPTDANGERCIPATRTQMENDAFQLH